MRAKYGFHLVEQCCGNASSQEACAYFTFSFVVHETMPKVVWYLKSYWLDIEMEEAFDGALPGNQKETQEPDPTNKEKCKLTEQIDMSIY